MLHAISPCVPLNQGGNVVEGIQFAFLAVVHPGPSLQGSYFNKCAYPRLLCVGDCLLVEVAQVISHRRRLVQVVQHPWVSRSAVGAKDAKVWVCSSLFSSSGLYRSILVVPTSYSIFIPVKWLSLHSKLVRASFPAAVVSGQVWKPSAIHSAEYPEE